MIVAVIVPPFPRHLAEQPTAAQQYRVIVGVVVRVIVEAAVTLPNRITVAPGGLDLQKGQTRS